MLIALLLAAAPQTPCNRDPAPIHMAQPVLPQGFRDPGSAQRKATVAITLDPDGKVTAVSIYKSSGNDVMDRAALEAARRSTFAPGAVDCRPEGGTFAADFDFQGYDSPLQCPSEAGVVSAAFPNLDDFSPQDAGGEISVAVSVTIAPDGRLVDARIVKSSGSMALDTAALDAARASKYRSKTIAVPVRRQASGAAADAYSETLCKAVTGTYIFRVTFRPNH